MKEYLFPTLLTGFMFVQALRGNEYWPLSAAGVVIGLACIGLIAALRSARK